MAACLVWRNFKKNPVSAAPQAPAGAPPSGERALLGQNLRKKLWGNRGGGAMTTQLPFHLAQRL